MILSTDLISWLADQADQQLIWSADKKISIFFLNFFLKRKTFFWIIWSTDLISWLADQQLIWSGWSTDQAYQQLIWSADIFFSVEVLSIDLWNKYLTGPSQSIVLWSFRYVMPKYCQVIFQTNTWLFWAKILSAYLSDKDMIVNKYLIVDKYFICDRFFIGEIHYSRQIFYWRHTLLKKPKYWATLALVKFKFSKLQNLNTPNHI